MGRILAIDPGSKRVGLALSDPTGTIAQALTTVPAEPAATLASRLAEIAKAQGALRIVVGLPLRLDGAHGPEAAAAQRLAHGLRRASGLPVEMVDERLTTAAAERSVIGGDARRGARAGRTSSRQRDERRLSIHRVAATLLLQGHLDNEARRERLDPSMPIPAAPRDKHAG